MGVFLVVTAFIVAVPVVAEVLEGRRQFREWLSPALLAIGLFTAGSGFWFLSPDVQSAVGMAGVLIAIAGLMLRGGTDDVPAPAKTAPVVTPESLGQSTP